MPSSTSHLEESGVWCADEESGDDFMANKLAPPCSPRGISTNKNKHSGGSVDASGDVQIVDLKEFDSSKKPKRRSNSSKMIRKNSKRKMIPRGKEMEYLRRIQALTRNRRSSSFSKVFSYRKTAPAAVMRPSSFGIKRYNKPRTVEVDDDDVVWPDPVLFKNKDSNHNKKTSEGERRRTKSTATYATEFTMKSGCTLMTDTASRNGANIFSKDSPTNTATFTRSIASRPSIGSSLLREPHFFSDDTKRKDDETPTLFLEGKEMASFDCEGHNTLQGARTSRDDIEEMVEGLNMRNFLHTREKSRAGNIGLPWLIKQLTCLYITTVIFILISLLILGLTIWLIQDNNSLRLDLHELKVLMNLYSSERDTQNSATFPEVRNSSQGFADRELDLPDVMF